MGTEEWARALADRRWAARPESAFALLLVTAALLPTTACGPGAVGGAIRPKDPKAADALGEGTCRNAKGEGQPLVVDLQAHERADLEEAMQSGVAVVGWDCTALKLLRECRAEGSYAFHGLSPQEFTVKLEDADEIKANLPTFGVKILSSFEAEMGRGASIDLAVSMVGKRRTTVSSLLTNELRGSCAGATHFVRGVYVGAFAMTTGSRGKVRAAADIFGAKVDASSASARVAENRDGDISACRTASASANAPPDRCSSLLRLELDPIGGAGDGQGDAKVAKLSASSDQCPDGMVFVEAEEGAGGKCALPSERPFQCRSEQPVECSDQCGRGHAGSCATLGFLYVAGRGVPKDATQAVSYFQKACDKKDGLGCTNLGVMLERGDGTSKDPARALSLYKSACDAGQMLGCYDLALVHELGRGTAADPARAATLYRRACDGGEAQACANLGLMIESGAGGTSGGAALAAKVYEKACQGDSPTGCYNLALLIEQGKGGVTADPAKAFALYSETCEHGLGAGCAREADFYERGSVVAKDLAKASELTRKGCDAGAAPACADLGLAYEEGRGLPKDPITAVSFYRKACENDGKSGCVNYGIALEEGQGMPKDVVKAAQIYDTACKRGEPLACVNLGDLLASGHGVSRDEERAATLFAEGCKAGAASGCTELGAFAESGAGGQKKDKSEAVRLYRLGCAGGSERSCKALDRLGASKTP